MPQFSDPAVAAAFARFAPGARARLLQLRTLIFEVAANDPQIGPLHETLKWGQPAYLTPTSRAGTTIRLGVSKTGEAALLFHCQTSVIRDCREVFGDWFRYDANRTILLDKGDEMPTEALALVIKSALCYHLRTRQTA